MYNSIPIIYFSKSWISVFNIQYRGRSVGNINSDLFAYAANNPVKYTDPDGNQNAPFMTPKEFFSIIFNNDAGAKATKTYIDATNGDEASKAVAGNLTKEAGKKMAADTLEVVADTSGVLAEVASDLALEACAVQPEVAGAVSTGAEILAGGEVLARAAKAAITKDTNDIDKAKTTAKKNFISSILGHAFHWGAKKQNEEIADLAGNVASKVYEKGSELIQDKKDKQDNQ